jgi:hypothetical protein
MIDASRHFSAQGRQHLSMTSMASGASRQRLLAMDLMINICKFTPIMIKSAHTCSILRKERPNELVKSA